MTADEFTNEVKRIRQQLKGIAERYLGNAEEAEDVVQDVLLKLWQIRNELHLPLYGFASAFVRNRSIDVLRKRRPTIDLDERLADSAETTDDRLEEVMKIVRTFPTMQQMVIELRHVQGMEMKEIADITGSNEAAVRQTLSRARQTIRRRFLESQQESKGK